MASLLCSPVLAVEDVGEGAKGVAQFVWFAGHVRLLAQFHEVLLEGDFVQRAELALRDRAERSKPRGQSPCARWTRKGFAAAPVRRAHRGLALRSMLLPPSRWPNPWPVCLPRLWLRNRC